MEVDFLFWSDENMKLVMVNKSNRGDGCSAL